MREIARLKGNQCPSEVAKKFHALEPEVAGGWGANTEFTRTPGKPVVVHKLHYEFVEWLGDELLQSDPCFIVTRRLAEILRTHHLSGYELRAVEVSKSEFFRDMYPGRELPEFTWLYIMGKAGVDGFGTGKDGRLVVSDRALAVLKTGQLDHFEISNFV